MAIETSEVKTTIVADGYLAQLVADSHALARVKAIRPDFLIAETDQDDDCSHARESVYEEFGNAGLQYAESFRNALGGQMKGYVTISKARFSNLVKAEEWLGYLERAGVDGTSAYEYAIQLRAEEEPVEDDDA